MLKYCIFALCAALCAHVVRALSGEYGSMGHTRNGRAERSVPDFEEDSLDEAISAEKELINRLLARYDRVGRGGRPVLNASSPVNVSFGLGLIQMDLNEKEKILTMSMWTRHTWVDEYLRWKPERYDGVTEIRVEPHQIWVPDIQLYNTADVDIPARAALAVVRYDGTVSWYPHCIFRSSCSIDVANFPFDEQRCNMAFGSWTHNAKEIDLQMAFSGGIDLSTFHADHMDSSAWDVCDVNATRQLVPPDDENHYSVLTFQLLLRRKIVFSSYILTLPCVFLASLTLVTFWLPPERPDRTALGMSTFSSFMVLLLILVESAPPTANTVPKLGVYYCFIMVIIMLSIILSSMVVNIARGPSNKTSPVPRFLAFITLGFLSRILFLHSATRAGEETLKPQTSSQQSKKPEGRTHHAGVLCCCVCGDKDSEKGDAVKRKPQGESKTGQRSRLLSSCDSAEVSRIPNGGYFSSERNPPQNVLESVLSDIDICLKRIEERMGREKAAKAEQHRIMWQWRCVATVLDRLFFVLYILLNVISMVVFFPRPKNMF